MVPQRSLLFALTVAALAGCAGRNGNSLLPLQAQQRSPERVSTIADRGPAGGISVALVLRPRQSVDLTAMYPHLPRPRHAAVRLSGAHPLSAFKQIEVDAFLYPGYASPNRFENDVLLPAPPGDVVSATVRFSNVPAGNNEWAVFYVYGVAADGSKVYLGTLASIVDVAGNAGTHVTANGASTLLWQAELAMIEGGQFSAADLKKFPQLAKSVASEIAAQHLTPQKSTGLYSSQQLYQFVKTWSPSWQRELVLTPNASAYYLTLANDAKSTVDAILFYNSSFSVFFNTGLIQDLRPFGAPCNSYVQTGTPAKKPVMVTYSCAAYWYGPLGGGGGSQPLAVYGGPLIVGQVNYTAPYSGTIQRVSPGAPGSTTTLTLGALQPRTLNVATNDPLDWAFGTYPSFDELNKAGAVLTEPTAEYYFDYQAVSGYSQANPIVQVLSWNPWGLPPSSFQICSWNQICQSLNAKSVLAVDPPFQDYGNNLAYFGWAVSGGGLSIAQAAGCGYRVTFSGSAFTLTSNTRTWLQPDQDVRLYFNSGCNIDPLGTRVTIAATGTDGHTYVNYGQNFNVAGSPIDVYMQSVTRDTPIASMTIGFSGLSGTMLDLSYINAPNAAIPGLRSASLRLAAQAKLRGQPRH
jgi:hypothetical protein